jgi:hypothetical protein
MTLVASPAWKRVTETTAESTGLTERETIDWRLWTRAVPTRIGSMVPCGRAACPPTPVTTMWNSSVAAMIGPGRMAKSPTAMPGMLCMP